MCKVDWFFSSFILCWVVQKNDAGQCTAPESTTGIKIDSDTYTCPKHQDCCDSGCCDQLYYLWYLWVLVILALVCCCVAGYVVKRKKMLKKRRVISCSQSFSEERARSRQRTPAHIFVTQNSVCRHSSTGIGGFTHDSFITPVEYFSSTDFNRHTAPAYTPTPSHGDSSQLQGQQRNEAPPSYSSIWSNN